VGFASAFGEVPLLVNDNLCAVLQLFFFIGSTISLDAIGCNWMRLLATGGRAVAGSMMYGSSLLMLYATFAILFVCGRCLPAWWWLTEDFQHNLKKERFAEDLVEKYVRKRSS